jgi:hypothetical protein
MNRIVVKSKVSCDGILYLSMSVGVDEADNEVLVPNNTSEFNRVPGLAIEDWQ